jgi:hypothetical protein
MGVSVRSVISIARTNGTMRRRNRVVLAPRSWRQVGGEDPSATGAIKPVPGESTYNVRRGKARFLRG